MNKALTIIKKAQSQGVKLELEDGSLVLKSENEEIDDALLMEIKRNKELIVEHFTKFDVSDTAYQRIDKDAIQPFDRDELEKIPLSFSQESLWFIHQLQGSLEYHLPFAFRLSGDLDKKALSLSLQQVVSRHEVLRTVIYAEDGVGYQRVLPADQWELSTKDLSDDASSLSGDLKSFMLTPFDLSSDFMFRSCLYDLGVNEHGEHEYVLASVFHHIASDAWSQGILTKEFVMLYSAYASGIPFDLPPLPLQYIDFALWQRTHLEGNLFEKQKEYWQQKLENFSELQLHTDYARPEVQSKSGSTVSFQVDTTLSNGIKSLSQREGATVFMTLLAAFKVLLSRYSGQEDICVGTSVANRTQKELEGIIGYFVNTLALRTHATADRTFKDFLQAVKQTTLDAYDHQQVPLETVVDLVVGARDQSTNPLFKVLFVLQNAPKSTAEGVELKGLTLSAYGEKIKETANFDLKLTAHETKRGFNFILNYSTDLYKESTIQRMVEHFQQLLAAIVQSPASSLSELEMLSKDEKHQLLEVFNDPNFSSLLYEGTVVDLFEEQVSKSPEAVAVVSEGKELTYQQLDERSNQLASQLISNGISSNDLVGICINRSLEMIVGILGILKSGGAYVPIDPEYPQERKDYMLEDTGVEILLTDRENSLNFSGREGLNVIELDTDWNKKFGEDGTKKLKSVASPGNLAYVIYTSGSTGRPKGVQIAHHSLTDYFFGIKGKTNIDSCSSFGLSSSIATDLGNTVLFPSLLTGGALYVLTEDELISAEKMAELDIDCLKMVPSHWKTLQTKDTVFVPNKCLILGGEAFTDDVLAMLASNNVSCEVYNHYGPTETTIGKLINKVSLTDDLDHAVPLGVPFGKNQVYILDHVSQLCPVGVAGELCIGGAGVAVGYLNQEELTNKKFIADPFQKGGRIYKTGDLARWLPDGKVEFLGRKDNQIKIRGYRIELGEIENALTSISGVDNGCVLAKADEYGDKSLVGYVVIDGDFNKENLQNQLLQSLPDYMVPQLWVELEEMPLTNNGKIDRKSLPEPDGADLSSREYVAPRNEAEEQLVDIWQDLLKVERVGIYDNFFELGGQSLLAIRLIARIQKLGYSVNIKDFYADPSIALLSTKLAAVETGYQVPENRIKPGCLYITPSMVTLADLSQEELETIMDNVPGGSENIQDIYPLSPLQEGIYYHHLISDADHGDPYVFPRLLPFQSPEQRSTFTEALQFVVNRHDVLRTCVLNDGLPQALQVVLRTVELPIEVLSIDNSKECLPQVQKELAPNRLYMDLTKAPMLQLKVADDVSNGVYYLLLQHHHMMIDHIGMAKVTEEIGMYMAGQAAMLPTPSLYRNYIGDTLNKEKLAESEQYFKKQYEAIESPTYPFNLSDTKVDGSTRLVHAQSMLSPELRDSIRKVAGDLKVSPAVLFHAAFGLVVGRCSNSDYAIFGSVLLGRLQGSKGSDSSLGLFMNTLPMLLELHGDAYSYINHSKDRLQELLNYEQTPLSKVHDWSGISTEVPLFSALLNYRHSTLRRSTTGYRNGNAEEVQSNVRQRTNYPFNVEIDDYGDDFKVTVILSDTGIEPASVVSYMEESLDALLNGIDHADSSTALADLSIISEEQKHQILDVFNDTAVSYPKDQTVVDLFEQQTEKTPEATAIVFGGETLTYQELNERSNQLARYLGSKGVGPNVLVGICINRSLEMLVGILGILKAGGAYVPIDPEYPQDRSDYMLEDSGVKVLLSAGDCAESFLSKDNLEIILLGQEWNQKVGKQSVKNLKRVADPDNLAYVIYTSGSTGKPKGVMNSHKGILNQLLWTQDTYGLTAEDVVLQKTTFSFDVSVWEILWPMISGAKLVFTRPGGQADVSSLKELIDAEQVTTIHFVPSMLGVFLSGSAVGDHSSLRRVVCSGEALTVEQVRSFRSLYPNLRMDNLYGPTEASVHVTVWSVPEDVSTLTRVPIGRPVANTSLYVLDRNDQIVSVGVVGELCIGGDQVAVGYRNLAELTKEQFVTNPFKTGDRLYRTGDLVRWLTDGTLEYIGRIDSQVKVRGYRIELGEIENILSLLPKVSQCCVLAKADRSGNNRLIAYVVMEDTLVKEELKLQLKNYLPEYMVPHLWVQLEEMPLTANGKLDKKGLPDFDGSDLLTEKYLAPQTNKELQLVEIWSELLGIEKVGIKDNFFELGGNSLLIIQLISTVNKQFGTTLRYSLILEHPTISGFAANMNVENSQGNETIVPLQTSGDQKPIFLLPEISGSAHSYHEFARAINKNQPLYALQCPGLDGKTKVSESIEEMAARFIDEMRKVNPTGPYRLAGYSFGSNVAYEMAVQLRQAGFEVDELIIFDGKITHREVMRPADEEEVFRAFIESLIQNFGQEFDWSGLVLTDKSIDEQIEEVYKRVDNTFNERELKGRLKVVFNNHWLLRKYKPANEEKLETPITLFKALYANNKVDGQQVLRNVDEFEYGWSEYTNKSVIVHSIAASHMTILDRKHVKEITELLNEEKEMSV
ncbi:MAG: amino acid adenylation domain-containing protein [Bacteroidota bacterium]